MIIHTKRDEFATHVIEKIKKTSFEDFLPKEKIFARKTIVFEKDNNYNFRKQSLEKLKEDIDTFNQIKFPEFTITYYDRELALIIESDFIEGRHIEKDDPETNIIWQEVVNRKSDWTFASFSYDNFIITKDNTLYYIDIDDYKVVPHSKRLLQFRRFY
tara:strand:- start:942 stop:1415 length:474 start_codon:yes stop_codon:yes gene_type:complete